MRLPGNQRERELLDPLHRIADAAPMTGAGIGENRRPRAAIIVSEIARQRIEFSEAEIRGQRAVQGCILRPCLRSRQPRNRHQQVIALRLRRPAAEDVQAVADLHLLEIAEMRIDRT